MNLLATYEKFNRETPAQEGLTSLRQAGYDYALKKGLPTRKDEDWHYTSVKRLSELEFATPLAVVPSLPAELMAEIKAQLPGQFINIVFVNGVLSKELSEELPTGFHLRDLPIETDYFADTFEALNSAYLIRPLAFTIAPETVVEKPVNFLFFSALSNGLAVMSHPRLHIEVGTRSSVQFVESYSGQSGVYFVNSMTDIKVAENAKVSYIRMQGDGADAVNIGRTRIHLKENAQLESLAFATGAILSRHSLELNLLGPGSHSQVLGVYAVTGSQHVDNTTVINHAVGNCDTNQLYKGILGGKSRAAFCGKVLIQKYAQKANSAQLNNNMLLSSQAEADSKPVLEIYADDVKASHGSTMGQLNREELFYMLSRAIPEGKAISMLSYGFLSEVLLRISNEKTRAWLTRHLDNAFAHLSMEKS